jgi:Acetyl/propionyl-CoA carboxylase, alpha subunit
LRLQIIGDHKGNVIAFGERECSVQRKYQKIIEETPSPFIDERTRRKMIKAAQDAAEEIGYQSLGTFEFLVDEKSDFILWKPIPGFRWSIP